MTITICIGSNCHIKGSYDVIRGLERLIKEKGLEDKVILKASFCLGECSKAVSVKVDDKPVTSVSKDALEDFFMEVIYGNNSIQTSQL